MATKKTGLGKGLDSLIADKTPKTQKKNAENTDGAVMMNITKVEPNREQPRKKFDEDTLQELSESIKQFGLIHPIIVKKKDTYYLLQILLT